MTFDVKSMTAEIISMSAGVLHIEVPRWQLIKMEETAPPLTCEIKQKRRRRSLNANAYFWEITGKLAEKIGATKEDIYRQAIHDVGAFVVATVAADDARRLCERWETKGLGWIAELIPPASGGKIQVMCYYGSSVYSTSEMSRLIEWIVDAAKNQGIETLTPAELAGMVDKWGGNHDR